MAAAAHSTLQYEALSHGRTGIIRGWSLPFPARCGARDLAQGSSHGSFPTMTNSTGVYHLMLPHRRRFAVAADGTDGESRTSDLATEKQRKYAASCMTWDAASIDNNTEDVLSENGQTDGTFAGLSHKREPWNARLSTSFVLFSRPQSFTFFIFKHMHVQTTAHKGCFQNSSVHPSVSGFSKTKEPWTVPWTSFTVVQVMFLWFCTFWLVGSWVIPFAAHCVGYSRDTLSYRGQALYSLIIDIAEGTVGLSILNRCLSRFHPLPKDWFPFSWHGHWYIDVLLGCLTFPIVNRLSQINLDLLPLSAPVASSYEQPIMARDPVALLVYAIVVSICCPIWEEVIFRGFLLPSLTRYLPVWASIFVSAVVFGLAHFNVQRVLPLSFLGLVMGSMFVRSRNLLPPMLLHSFWNGFVFLGLLK